MAKSKTVADAVVDGTLPEVPPGFIKRVARLKSPVAGMLKDDVPAGAAIDLIDAKERGDKFKPRGRSADPIHAKLLEHILYLQESGNLTLWGERLTVADVWVALSKRPPRGWKFFGNPVQARNRPISFAEHNGEHVFTYAGFANLFARKKWKSSITER
jgi:hypothetical protein